MTKYRFLVLYRQDFSKIKLIHMYITKPQTLQYKLFILLRQLNSKLQTSWKISITSSSLLKVKIISIKSHTKHNLCNFSTINCWCYLFTFVEMFNISNLNFDVFPCSRVLSCSASAISSSGAWPLFSAENYHVTSAVHSPLQNKMALSSLHCDRRIVVSHWKNN